MSDCDLLRHSLATLAYRAAKVLRDVPPGFAQFRVSDTLRTPAEILAHMADLLDWALSIVQGRQRWQDSPPLDWPLASDRFFAALRDFDAFLASAESLEPSAAKLFQGPIADALTHTGQIALLRRLAGSPVRGENYFRANIAIGTTGPAQAQPVREF
jgi:hypothetical protein